MDIWVAKMQFNKRPWFKVPNAFHETQNDTWIQRSFIATSAMRRLTKNQGKHAPS